jgi:hypothetical protein
MVVVLLAFSATGSLQCSARCPGLARRRQLGAPESQQRWLYQRDVVEKRAGPVLSVDPTSASRAVRMISSCRNSATRSREHTRLHPARVGSSGSLLRGSALLFRSSSRENVRQGIIPLGASVLIDRTVRRPHRNLDAPGLGE